MAAVTLAKLRMDGNAQSTQKENLFVFLVLKPPKRETLKRSLWRKLKTLPHRIQHNKTQTLKPLEILEEIVRKIIGRF